MNNYEKAGLIPAGKNEDGEQLWMGTKSMWNKLEELDLDEANLNAQCDEEKLGDGLNNEQAVGGV